MKQSRKKEAGESEGTGSDRSMILAAAAPRGMSRTSPRKSLTPLTCQTSCSLADIIRLIKSFVSSTANKSEASEHLMRTVSSPTWACRRGNSTVVLGLSRSLREGKGMSIEPTLSHNNQK